MSDRPEFAKLRAERTAAMDFSMAAVRKWFAEKMGVSPDAVTVPASGPHTDDCYCDCANHGPCEHEFEGWREFDDRRGGETVCKNCGLGAMSHDMWLID